MTPVFFKDQNEFREWLRKNHKKETELIVGFHKVNSGKHNMSWSQSVDQALCFGWIDGVRRSIDKDSYCIRFTPRRPGSVWSAVNIKKIEELTKNGLMDPAGTAAFAKRKPLKSNLYSFENKPNELPAEYEKKFRANKKAWDFFSNLAPSYKRTAMFWIMAAKQEETRKRRLDKTIEESEKGNRIY
jgi:uncharacterized protein YdeI (YjbR/CyaY-like superfamily)